MMMNNELQEDSLGMLLIQLNYLPSVQRLTVTILEGKGLKTMDIAGAAGTHTQTK